MEEEDVGSLPNLIRRRTKRRTSVFTGAPVASANGRRASIQVTRKLKESNSSSTEKLVPSSKAILLWDKLRAHVKRGFFRSILAQTETAPTFVSIVTDLWTQTHLYSFPNGQSSGDTTTDFVMSGLTAVKASRPSWAKSAPKKGASVSGNETMHSIFMGTRAIGFDGLSFDTVPNCKVASILMQIAQGLNDRNLGDLYTNQVHLNRGWKLIVTGLTQAESSARYLAMLALRRAIPVIKETLLDVSTRSKMIEILVNLMVSDERRENRLKAVYLLGQLGFYLGAVQEHDELMFSSFKSLAKVLLAIQTKEKLTNREPDNETQQFKVCLYHAIGKYTCHLHRKTQQIHDTVLYLIHEEFGLMNSRRDMRTAEKSDPQTFLLLGVLGILDNEFHRTESNYRYVGALFKQYVHPLMRSKVAAVQKMAVQFVSNWFPITQKTAYIQGLGIIMDGLAQSRLLVQSDETQLMFDRENQQLKERLEDEKLRVAYIEKNLHIISQPPGTWTSLHPVPGHPGFFLDPSSSLRNTRTILVDLPVHPLASVSVSRPVPPIPGVPPSMSTIPFLFADDTWLAAQKAPQTHYELLEQAGRAPDLPPGFSYGPNALVSPAAGEGNDLVADSTMLSSAMPLPAGESITIRIPQNSTIVPPKMIEAILSDPRRIPYGFIGMCPHPGYDPDRPDKNRTRLSSIYGHEITFGRAGTVKVGTPTERATVPSDFPPGTTGKRHPVLWPAKESLVAVTDDFDFPIHAPIVFDIVHPQSGVLQRILTKVRSIGQELSPIVSQRRNSVGNDDAVLSGSRFNIYVRKRSAPDSWLAVHLEVVDDQYNDIADFFRPRAMAISKTSSADKVAGGKGLSQSVYGETIPYPVPVGITSGGDPYFAPPVNFPPLPLGYTEDGSPYYGHTNAVFPHPMGLTKDGLRFYSADGKLLTPDTPARFVTGGYSYSGNAFYIPRGLSLPPPAGFTSDGIAYYDIPSMLLHPGTILLPKSPDALEASILTEDEKLHALLVKGVATDEFTEAINKLLESFGPDHQSVKNSFLSASSRSLWNSNMEFGNDTNILSGNLALRYKEPRDIPSLLKTVDQFAHLKGNAMRLSLEPSAVSFQSVNLGITKTIVLRYRAGRGDRELRDFFLSVQPSDVFSLTNSHLALQGEGVQEVDIFYNPSAMKSEKIEGSLSLIDDSGRSLATSTLLAVRQNFFSASPSTMDAGWIVPGNSKSLGLRLTNTSTIQINVNLCLESEKRGSDSDAAQSSLRKRAAFEVGKTTMRLQPQESIVLPITFFAHAPGKYSDSIDIVGPGGDITKIGLCFTSGIPIVIYPENEENSKAGSAALTRERSSFLKKFSKLDANQKLHITNNDTPILQSIMAVLADSNTRKSAHTLDFGISPPKTAKQTRCVSIFNLGDSPLTVALHSHHTGVSCPYLVRIAPRMANTVEIDLLASADGWNGSGNINATIEVVCSDFQECSINVTGIYWTAAFFPTSHGAEQGRKSRIVTSLDDKGPTRIAAFSMMPVSFVYEANDIGPFMQSFDIQILKPFKLFLTTALPNKSLKLIGMCIEPKPFSMDEANPNGIDFVKQWISHPSRVSDEYPTLSERQKLFDQSITANKAVQKEISFVTRTPMVYNMPGLYSETVASGPDGFTSFRSKNATVTLKNTSEKYRTVTIFGSPYFTPNARNKTIQPGGDSVLEVLFAPPSDLLPFLNVYGAVITAADDDSNFDSFQVSTRPSVNVLVVPCPNNDGIISLDFGTVEVSAGQATSSEQSITIFNMMPSPAAWIVKFNAGKSKFNAFSMSLKEGEIAMGESRTLGIKFQSDTSGEFESRLDIFARDTMERGTQFTKIGFVILRGATQIMSLTGIPESIDFGNTLVSQEKSNVFQITNSGSVAVELRFLARAPFLVQPKGVKLGPRESAAVKISFKPFESCLVSSKLQIFSGNKQYFVPLNGVGGTAELICERFDDKPIDFGYQLEDTISWISVFITNRGSLPLSLHNITAKYPKLVKLKFIGITSIVPYDRGGSSSVQNPNSGLTQERDYWSLLRRKRHLILALRDVKGVSVRSDPEFVAKANVSKYGQKIAILPEGHAKETATPNPQLRVTPKLPPFHSYHFKIGYCSSYGKVSATRIDFLYKPRLNDDETNLADVKRLCINVIGGAYRPLEFVPSFHDYGLIPADSCGPISHSQMQKEDSYQSLGVFKSSDQLARPVFNLVVLNLSLESQNLALKALHPEFLINNRMWNLQPGEKKDILIEFNPSREQIQVHGKAHFKHTHGEKSILLTGTGACAEWTADQMLNWGNMKVGTVVEKSFTIKNRGYLPLHFELEIVQAATDFRFLGGDPFECDGVVMPGTSKAMRVICDCQTNTSRPSFIQVRWLRIPNSTWIYESVPLKVKVGIPGFKFKTSEIDFRTVYIDLERTETITITNDGNAICGWSADFSNAFLMIDKRSGQLSPGQSDTISITYSPKTYDPLNVPIRFQTDAGQKTLTCYGIVGVPYLKIPNEHLNVEFGVVAVGKPQSRPITLKNTGTKMIEFEVANVEQLSNGLPRPIGDFDLFYFEPSVGQVAGGDTAIINLFVKTKVYLAAYELRFNLITKDGEMYKGTASAIGGQAIVKIKRNDSEFDDTPAGIEMREHSEVSKETKREILLSHIENLREIIAGLRVAEMEETAAIASEQNSRPISARSVGQGVPATEPTKIGSRAMSPSLVFDGSNLKASSRSLDGSRVLPASEGSPELNVNRETETVTRAPEYEQKQDAIAFAQELERLEREFEAQLELLDGTSSGSQSRPTTAPSLPSRPSSRPDSRESSQRKGRRYHSGRPGKKLPSRVPLDMPSSAKDLISDLDSLVAQAAAEKPVSEDQKALNTETTDLIKKVQQETLAAESSMTALTAGLDAQVIEPSSALISPKLPTDTEAAVDSLKPIQDPISPDEAKVFERANREISKRTYNVVKAVKERLEGAWVGNREFLATALRKLERSSNLLDFSNRTAHADAIVESSTYDFGLIKGDTKSHIMSLFQLSNDGNLGFDFVITPVESDCVRPPIDPNDASDGKIPYEILPQYGTILPGARIDLTSCFQAKVSGLYRQKFIVTSGGDEIRSFVLKARIGNANIICDPVTLDFGLVNRYTEVSRSLMVSNTGTYSDAWKMEIAESKEADDESASRSLPYRIDISEGELTPQQSQVVQVTFSPPMEGDFRAVARIHWIRGPLIVPIFGVGGGSRFVLQYTNNQDELFNGLDWGVCVIGNRYEKTFIIQNVGNIEGFADFVFPKNYFTYEVERNEAGLVSVPNGSSRDIKIYFEPTQVENGKDNIQVTQVNGKPVLMPFKYKAGICSWKVEGQLDFLNMKYGTREERSIDINNDGTLDIPVSYKLIASANLNKLYEVSVKPAWTQGKALKPGQSLKITVAVFPSEISSFDGILSVSTDLGKGPVEVPLPFSFQTFKDEFALNDDSDASVGRIMMGDSADVSRSMKNFGNSRIKWKISIKPIPSANGVIRQAWSLVSDETGEILSGEEIPILIRYNAPMEEFNEWVEAAISLEKREKGEEEDWNIISTFRVQGANGVPKLTFDPPVVSFGKCSINGQITASFVLKNEGNARVDYRVLPNWEHTDQFAFVDSSVLNGSLLPGTVQNAEILFKPDAVIFYDTEIYFQTQITKRVLHLTGQGVEYKLNEVSLPKSINLGSISFGESRDFEFELMNGCAFEIEGNCFLYSQDPVENDAVLCDYSTVEPSSFTFAESQGSEASPAVPVKIKMYLDCKEDSDGLLDSDYFSRMCALAVPQMFLKISVTGGKYHIIPVEFSISFQPLMILRDAVYETLTIEEQDVIRSLDFGTQSFGSGGVLNAVLYNPNMFRVALWPELEGPQFSVTASAKTIAGRSFEKLTITLNPVEFKDDEIAPSSQSYSGKVALTTHLEQLAPPSLTLVGILIDSCPDVEVVRSIDFECVHEQKTKVLSFTLRNPARRPLLWKFFVEPDFSDIFVVVEETEGSIPPRKSIDVYIQFRPKFAVDYTAKAYLETDQGNFVLTLTGSCVAPKIESSDRDKDFGIIGIGHAEFREITITNPTVLPLPVRATTDGDEFQTDVKEFVLPPNGSRVVRVAYDPSVRVPHRGSVTFSYLEDVAVQDSEEAQPEQGLEKDDLDRGTLRRKSYSSRKSLGTLQEISVAGKGGVFALKLDGKPVDVISEEEEPEEKIVEEAKVPSEALTSPPNESKDSVGAKTKDSSIIVRFAKVTTGQLVRRTFETENFGDTMVELVIMTPDGREILTEESIPGIHGFATFTISPVRVRVPPRTVASFEVVAQGGDPGQDMVDLQLSVINLLSPIIRPIKIEAVVLPVMTSESLKAFVRADRSVDNSTSLELMEAKAFEKEMDLWKVLVPVLRTGPYHVSLAFSSVPMVEPTLTYPDMGPYLIRPPAIPVSLPAQARKWYSKRMSMSLDVTHRAREASVSASNHAIKRTEALAMVKSFEKKIKLLD